VNDSKNAFYMGLVVIVGVTIGVMFFVNSRKSELNDSNSHAYHAFLTDVSGVNAKSLITVAGLQVGEVQNIELVAITRGELESHVRKQKEAAHAADLVKWQERVAKWKADYESRFPESDLPELPRKIAREEPAPLPAWDADEVLRVARVDIRVRNDLDIPNDSWLKKESLGLLGANALFLDMGSPDKAVIPPGGRIVNVRSSTGMGALQDEAGEIVTNLKNITAKIDEDIGGITSDIHAITTQVSEVDLQRVYDELLADLGKATRTIDKAVRDVDKMLVNNDKAVSGMLANIERITGDIAEMTSGVNGDADGDGVGDIRATMGDIRKVAKDLSGITGTLNEVLGENEDDVGDAVGELKNTISDLNRSLASLAEVTEKIENGEGAVGKLLTDEAMGDKIEYAVAGVSDYVASLTAIETHVDLGVWYPARRGVSTTALGLKLQPRPDKFYLFEVVDDGGGLEKLTQFFTDENGDGVRTVERTEDNTLRITAMFGKKFWDFLVLRAGIIETSGGVGADLLFWDDRVHLRSDMFNFGGPRNYLSGDTGDPFVYETPYLPRWRTMLKVQPIPHIYIMGGIDDVLNWQVDPLAQCGASTRCNYGIDFLIGVGITFQDEDLRAILPFVPSL
jgi:phospholipid/cholesterol/gamma-HCH transport system substrate-binding protein